MNTKANNRSNHISSASSKNNHACILPFIPKKNTEHLDLSDVLGRMSRFLSRDKELEIVYDFNGDKSIIKSLYQEKSPNRLDAEKTIKRMQDLNCNVLIVPTLRTLAEQPDPCREIMVALYEADIRLISPFEDFDSKAFDEEEPDGIAEFLSELRKSLHRAISHCVTQNVDDFMDYVDRASALYKHTNFVLAYGNKAIKIPYSEELCMEIFDFLDLLDRHYLRPELYSDYESDDNDIPKSEYDEPLVERDFEG